MGRASTLVSVAGMQAQVFSLWSRVALPWPNEFLRILNILELFNLNPREFLGVRDLPVIDFRILFIVVANVLPLLVTFLILIVFQPLSAVLWYAMTGTSVVTIAAGLMIHFMERRPIGLWFAAGGGVLLLLCLAIGLVAYLLHHVDDDTKLQRYGSNVKQKQEVKREMKLRFSKPRSVKLLLATVASVVAGCLLNSFFFDVGLHAHEERDTLRAIGFALLFFASITFIYFVLSLTFEGRLKVYNCHTFLRANVLMVLLLVLSIIYIPVITYCINVFLCTTYECPSGTRFNPNANRPRESYSTAPSLFCDECNFRDPRCARNGTAPADPIARCPAFSSTRVWRGPDVVCNDEASVFFFVSALLVIPVFVGIIPGMYFALIRNVTEIVHREVALVPDEGEVLERVPPAELYERRVYAVEPAAASLFQPFRWNSRFASIALLFFQLLVVTCSNVLSPFTTLGALSALLVVNVAATLLLTRHRPFISVIEFSVCVACALLNVTNCIYGGLLYFSVELPGWVGYVVLGLNILVPIAAGLMSIKFVKRRTRESARGKKMLKRVRTHQKLRLHHQRAASPSVGDSWAATALLSGGGGGDGGGVEQEENRSYEDDIEMTRDEDRPRGLLHKVSFHPSTQPMPARPGGSRQVSSVSSPAPERTSEELERLIAAAAARNDVITLGINEATSRLMTKFFSISGFLLLIALGASVSGVFKAPDSMFVDGSSPHQRSERFVLGGYPSWPAFVGNCCCIVAASPPPQYAVMERWVCANEVTVSRGRVSGNGQDSGLALRALCDRNFTHGLGCEVTSSGDVALTCNNTQQLRELRVSSLALRLFW